MIWEGEFESRKVGVLLIVVNNELSKCLAGEFFKFQRRVCKGILFVTDF